MANLIGVLGPSGTGKSTSLEGLDPNETFIIRAIKKDLPFRSARKYVEGKNMLTTENYRAAIALIEKLDTTKNPFKQLIVDDATFFMIREFFDKATETGYTKFTQAAKNFEHFTAVCRNLKKDKFCVVMMFHSEHVFSDNTIVDIKFKLTGKMVEEKLDPQTLFTTILCTHVKTGLTQQDRPEYYFVTNKWGVYPAKTPRGMFEEVLIPNDMKVVIDAVNDYYA